MEVVTPQVYRFPRLFAPAMNHSRSKTPLPTPLLLNHLLPVASVRTGKSPLAPAPALELANLKTTAHRFYLHSGCLQSHFSEANWWLSSHIWLQYFFPSVQIQEQAACAHFLGSDIGPSLGVARDILGRALA